MRNRINQRPWLAAMMSLIIADGAVGTVWAQGGPGQGPPQRPGGGPSGDFGPGMFIAPRILELADADQDGKISADEAAKAVSKLVSEADRKKVGGLDQDGLAAAINRNFGPPGEGPGPEDGPPGGFGPGMFWAPGIFQAGDTNKDGKLTPEEASAAVTKFLADTKEVGPLNEATLAKLINQRIGFPGGGPGGPGGGGRGDPRGIVRHRLQRHYACDPPFSSMIWFPYRIPVQTSILDGGQGLIERGLRIED